MNVIDVSEHQGKINWQKVKADGIEGVVIRAGYGKGNIDKQLYNNLKGAIENDLHIGVYWFSYAFTESMAAREAKFCNDAIAEYKDKIDMPVFFDWEYDSMKFAKKNGVNPDRNLITNMTEAFCAGIQSLGYTAGYYLNYDYEKNYYDESQLKSFKRWYARYTKKEWKDCYLWQYSSSGAVNGINGNVDMNILWGVISPDNPAPAPEQPQKPHKSNEEIAKEIWEGKWGNEPERRDKLVAEGYDYDAIKKLVNESKYGYHIGKTYHVNCKLLNIRSGAGMNNPIIGVAKKGTAVKVVDVKKVGTETWVRGENTGWLCAVGRGTYIS